MIKIITNQRSFRERTLVAEIITGQLHKKIEASKLKRSVSK